jgi:arabinose-5-phosphate isomerase
MKDVIYEMNSKKLGMTCVVEQGRLVGIITDGDLRRHMTDSLSIVERTAGEIMTPNPVTVGRDLFAVEALNVMEQRKITAVVVVDAAQRVEGVVHLHALWRTEMI